MDIDPKQDGCGRRKLRGQGLAGATGTALVKNPGVAVAAGLVAGWLCEKIFDSLLGLLPSWVPFAATSVLAIGTGGRLLRPQGVVAGRGRGRRDRRRPEGGDRAATAEGPPNSRPSSSPTGRPRSLPCRTRPKPSSTRIDDPAPDHWLRPCSCAMLLAACCEALQRCRWARQPDAGLLLPVPGSVPWSMIPTARPTTRSLTGAIPRRR